MHLDLYLGFVIASTDPDPDPRPECLADRGEFDRPWHALRSAHRGRNLIGDRGPACTDRARPHRHSRHARRWFEWIRWIGVAYLLYLGIRQWTAAPVDLTHTRPQPRSFRAITLRGFLISLTNPKTLLFYGAFFPQFLVPDAPIAPQVALLSLTFFAIAAGLDCGWALLAGRVRGVLAVRGRLRNRLSGGFLIGAGVGLALAHRE